MRCPICGAKLFKKTICPFCKVTADEVRVASNKKVKTYRKTGRKDLIHFTNVIPKDVNKVKLWLYTIFLGLFGVNHFLVYRNVRAGYSVGSTAACLTMFAIKSFAQIPGNVALIILEFMYEIAFYSMAINLILWLSDIFALIIKTFKVPVVLPEKENKNG